ncbi:MAG: PAS domain S-box protein [Syntrophorhabdaceae bacterium]
MNKKPTYQDLEQGVVHKTDKVHDVLPDSEERSPLTSMNFADAIWDWNIAQGKVEWFGNIDSMLGYDTGEFPRTIEAWETAIHPDDRDRVMTALRLHLKQAAPYNVKYRVVHKSGNLRYFRERGIAIHDKEGNPVRMIGVCTDITDRKKAEEILIDSEEKYRVLLNHAVDAIMITDVEGRFLEVNQKAEELLGCTREELLGMKFTGIHPEEEREKVIESFTGMVEGNMYSCNDTKVLRKDGTTVPVDITGTFVEYAGKKVMQGIFRDVTERKQAEESLREFYDQLEVRVQERTSELTSAYKYLQHEMEERKRVEEQLRKSQKMKAIGTLAGGIAHDFNNILAGIMGFTEMVRENTDPKSSEYHWLGLVLKGAYRGRDLVRQILTFSRQTEHEQKPVALSLVIDEVLKLLRPLLPATTQIQFKSTTDDDTIMADSAQIHQVLMNLCTNSVHAIGKKGGLLEISVASAQYGQEEPMPVPEMTPGEYVTLKVRDTGCGMKPEIIERIFDPFFTTKAHGEGSGLGLSVVHGIVRSHGGFLTVASTPGKGSLFSIYLPKTERQEMRAAEEIPPVGGKECILFVDDEDILVQLNYERLTRLGYDVVGVTSSSEALRIFRKAPGRFDLVITDYTMPDITGIGLAKKFLKIRNDIPIILCTGHNDDISPERAKKAGISEFLLKPQSKRELDQVIRRTLDTKSEPK